MVDDNRQGPTSLAGGDESGAYLRSELASMTRLNEEETRLSTPPICAPFFTRYSIPPSSFSVQISAIFSFRTTRADA